jgi:peptide/nickel transport system ATP-binding protein/oligopeptide transport system ATP-binding protein
MTENPLSGAQTNPIVKVSHLKKYYPVQGGIFQRVREWIKAVDDISFHISKGETFGLVGESGCGKTTVGRTMLRLIDATAGNVLFEGKDILNLESRELKAIRRDMQIIFQDPCASLNPRMTAGNSIMQGLEIHGIGTAHDRRDMAVEILRKVGLEEYQFHRFPHEFSGGQRQRIGIARALVLRPKFIICDEPVSALDISIQSQVLNLLKDLQDEFSLTYLFIAHNLSVVQHISDYVGVMYLGKAVELASKDELFLHPLHPYTQALISAIPIPSPHSKQKRIILQGDVPSPLHPPKGCRFHPRCPLAADICHKEEPQLINYGNDHWAACWLIGK